MQTQTIWVIQQLQAHRLTEYKDLFCAKFCDPPNYMIRYIALIQPTWNSNPNPNPTVTTVPILGSQNSVDHKIRNYNMNNSNLFLNHIL